MPLEKYKQVLKHINNFMHDCDCEGVNLCHNIENVMHKNNKYQ